MELVERGCYSESEGLRGFDPLCSDQMGSVHPCIDQMEFGPLYIAIRCVFCTQVVPEYR